MVHTKKNKVKELRKEANKIKKVNQFLFFSKCKASKKKFTTKISGNKLYSAFLAFIGYALETKYGRTLFFLTNDKCPKKRARAVVRIVHYCFRHFPLKRGYEAISDPYVGKFEKKKFYYVGISFPIESGGSLVECGHGFDFGRKLCKVLQPYMRVDDLTMVACNTFNKMADDEWAVVPYDPFE